MNSSKSKKIKLKGQDTIEFVCTIIYPIAMTWIFIAIAFIWYSMNSNAALSLEAASKGQDYGLGYMTSLGEELIPFNPPIFSKTGMPGEGMFQGDFDLYTTTLPPKDIIGVPLGFSIVNKNDLINTTIVPVWRYH